MSFIMCVKISCESLTFKSRETENEIKITVHWMNKLN